MTEEIAKRVPMLAKRDEDHWKLAEQVRRDFIRDYPLERITALTLDEYVIGKGSDNRSFCYRLEREMNALGLILGATAFKFGVYFGRTKKDPTNEYRFASHWGRTLDEAFNAVKLSIADLLRAAARKDSQSIVKNELSPMFKGKLLFVYHPDQFAPIYSEEHLGHFVAHLNLPGSFNCGVAMQQALMDYRTTWPLLMSQPAALYMRLLYDVFGPPPKDESPNEAVAPLPRLDEALKNAQLLSEFPESSSNEASDERIAAKIDFQKRAAHLKRIGDRGEAIVLALEQRRLIDLGRPELAMRIRHVSQEDDSVGFDILSFDADGTERPIEVKATNLANLGNGFYITSNEVEKAGALSNYHVYFVFSTSSKQPRILPVKCPALSGGEFAMRPVVYHVAHIGP